MNQWTYVCSVCQCESSSILRGSSKSAAVRPCTHTHTHISTSCSCHMIHSLSHWPKFRDITTVPSWTNTTIRTVYWSLSLLYLFLPHVSQRRSDRQIAVTPLSFISFLWGPVHFLFVSGRLETHQQFIQFSKGQTESDAPEKSVTSCVHRTTDWASTDDSWSSVCKLWWSLGDNFPVHFCSWWVCLTWRFVSNLPVSRPTRFTFPRSYTALIPKSSVPINHLHPQACENNGAVHLNLKSGVGTCFS